MRKKDGPGVGAYDVISALDASRPRMSTGVKFRKEGKSVNLLKKQEELKGQMGSKYEAISLDREKVENNWKHGFTMGKPESVVSKSKTRSFVRNYDPLKNGWSTSMLPDPSHHDDPLGAGFSRYTGPSFTDELGDITFGRRRKSQFDPTIGETRPAPGQYYKYGKMQDLPGGVILAGPRFPGESAVMGASPDWIGSDKDFLKLNRESRENLTQEGQTEHFINNVSRQRQRGELVKEKLAEKARIEEEKAMKILALSRISADELKGGRRWGALMILAHLNGPKGVLRRILKHDRAHLSVDRAARMITKFMIVTTTNSRFHRNIEEIKRKCPNIKFIINELPQRLAS